MYIGFRNLDGTFFGVERLADRAVIPRDPSRADWLAFLAWDAQQPVPLDQSDYPKAPRRPRSLYAIRADLTLLTNQQKTNVWDALMADDPPLWVKDLGRNAAALAVLQLLGASGTLLAADMLEAKLRAVAAYVQDNPAWLTEPAFDPTINVAGDELAT